MTSRNPLISAPRRSSDSGLGINLISTESADLAGQVADPTSQTGGTAGATPSDESACPAAYFISVVAADSSLGAQALKALRERAGYSQVQLAERSGVSVRSVGGIERGEIKAPHPSTLTALAEALGLSVCESDRLLRSWQETVRFRNYREIMSRDVHQGLLRAVREASIRSTLDKRVVSLSYQVVVGSNRCIHQVRHDFVIEAYRDGVDSHLIVCQRDVGDARLLRIEDTAGCAVSSQTVDPATNLVAIDLSLGHVLKRGELTSFGFRQVNGWDKTQDEDAQVPARVARDTRYASRPRTPVDLLAIRVTFAHDTVPVRAWPLGGVAPTQRETDLEIDHSRTVGKIWQDAVAGEYAIQWKWA